MAAPAPVAYKAIPLTILASTDVTDTPADIRGMRLFVLENDTVTTVNYSIKTGRLANGSDAQAAVDSTGAAITFTATDAKNIALNTDALAVALAASDYVTFVADTGAEGSERDLVLHCSA